MKNFINNLKVLFSNPKTWIVIVALFGTNGMQAYFNTGSIVEPVKVANKAEIEPITIKVITVNCGGKVKEHIVEHHGGR